MARRSKDTDAAVIATLQKVTELVASTAEELQRYMRSSAETGGPQPVAGGLVNSWDDPFTEAVATNNPNLAAPAPVDVASSDFETLRTVIPDPRPPLGLYNPGTAEFRYWVAAEAIARGIKFWGNLLPSGTTWSAADPMRVTLVEDGTQLNANYTRLFGLRFYRQQVLNFDIFACESPDVVCHELGHAVLDALRPQLFNVANIEVGAFHESFGDMSAMLCALQVPAMRRAVLAETGGRLNTNSRLSRLAEQLGWGLRQISPNSVDRDCLRNAANKFFYQRPDLLPPSAPAGQLSTEEHSFSRVFTGAFLDALARMFSSTSSHDEAGLLTVSRDIGQLLIDAVHGAPIAPAYFSQVAAAMVQAEQARFSGRYHAELFGAFLEHGILSVGSAMRMATAPVPAPVVPPVPVVPGETRAMTGDLGAPVIFSYEDRKDDEAHALGFGETPELPVRAVTVSDGFTLGVHAAEEPPRFAVESAMVGTDGGLSQDAAAQAFVAGLIQRQQVDLQAETKSITGEGKKSAGRRTHRLVVEDGKQVLKRDFFSCGCFGCGAVQAADRRRRTSRG